VFTTLISVLRLLVLVAALTGAHGHETLSAATPEFTTEHSHLQHEAWMTLEVAVEGPDKTLDYLPAMPDNG
jgi:hypothetical protein